MITLHEVQQKDNDRSVIQRDVDIFIDAGGRIKIVPECVSTDVVNKNMRKTTSHFRKQDGSWSWSS